MKSLRTHRWLAALAALLLLLGTAAPALVRMSCLSGGHTVVSIGQAEDCCPKDQPHHDGAQLRARCCEMERTAPERDAFTTESGFSFATVFMRTPEAHLWPASHPMAAISGYGFTSRSPPLLTTERLSRVCGFLI